MKVLVFVSIVIAASVKSAADHRVVGGQNAAQNEFPWMVSLQRANDVSRQRIVCGGAILNKCFVITAAQCFITAEELLVVVGIYNLNLTEHTEQRSTILYKAIHPGYNGGVGPHDLAIVRLNKSLIFNEAVQPISLPRSDFLHKGWVCLSGWGPIAPFLELYSNNLQKSVVEIISFDECFAAIGAVGPLEQSNMCTGPLNERATVCRSDSGSPLVTIDQNPELVGIVSWSIVPCGMTKVPSVYVRMGPYLDWIKQNIECDGGSI